MKDNKKIKLLIILLILLVIIFVIQALIDYISSYDKTEKAVEQYGYETMPVYKDPDIKYETEKNIEYINLTAVQALKGDLPTGTVIKKVKTVFVEEIPKVIDEVKQYDNSKLKSYYSNNSSVIREKLRIDTEESFINMVNQFKEISCNLNTEFKSCEFMNEDGLSLKFLYETGEFIECNIIGENASLILFEF